ncbi:NAD(P)-dependent alcohol dehydrogenase [Arthrobacter silvisoli]|uniref:NAD(P)-dependent alcohol dehydrogenase n=1 Tax=Arthrobacter silvisoli TaxID=2291022 RepID=UPI001FE4CD94|nr:NAD(P)-dependent alcohol dehydrogenase [Arthrobacter silvisoli]
MKTQERSHRQGTETTDMRAIARESYGGPEVLRLKRVARPVVKGKDVLVRVRAAGVDRGVWHIMTGLPYLGRLAFGLRKPKDQVLGMDLAGIVEAVGPEATKFAVGDAVYGSGRGSYAEYAVAPEAKLAAKPQNLSFEQAAAVPVSAVTALQGLRTGKIQPGQKVLVTGASGGVGSYAVQLAKAYGAHVTGACSTGKVGFVRDLGADQVIDYTCEDFVEAGPFDLILDIAGNPRIPRLRRALTATGTAVITGGEGGGKLGGGLHRQLGAIALSPFIGQRLTMFFGLVRSADLQDVSRLIEAGEITPALDRSFTLAEAKDALRYLEDGHVAGKVTLSV